MAWADEIAKQNLTLAANLRIDGIPYEFCTRIPTSWVAGMPAGKTLFDGLEIPGEFVSGVDPKQWKTRDGQVTFTLTDLPEGTTNYRMSSFFAGVSMARAGNATWSTTVATDVAVSDTTIAFEHDNGMPGTPFDLHIGHECVSVGVAVVAPTYNVTRHLYPCVTALGFRHKATDEGDSGVLVASTQPSAWFNRMVALYLTWLDENGNWGARADARLRWTGRIKAIRFLGNDRWSLECAPITEDLDRPIFSRPMARSQMDIGVELRGLAASDRTIRFYHDATTVIGSVTVAAAFYPFPTFLTTVVTTINAALTYAIHGVFGASWAASADGEESWRVQLFWERPAVGAGNATEMALGLPAPIASILGYARAPDESQAGVYWDDMNASTTEARVADIPPAVLWWSRKCSHLRLLDASGFTTTTTGDGGNPAVRVGNQTILRYESVATNDLVIPPFVDRSALTTTLGESALVVRAGDSVDPIDVTEVYLMPRSYGATTRSIFTHILRLMESTGSGPGGPNGSFDDLPAEYGLGILSDVIDEDSFTNARATSHAATQERQWYIDTPTSLREIIDVEAATMGFFVLQNSSGQIALQRIAGTLAGASAVTLTEGNKADPLERSTWELSPATLVNSVRIQYDVDPLDRWDPSTLNITDRVSQATYSDIRGITVTNRGLFNFPTTDVAGIAIGMTTRFSEQSNPMVRIRRSISRDLFTRILPGDVVRLTDSGVPDPDTGGRGVTTRSFRVVEVAENYTECKGHVVLVRSAYRPAVFDVPLCPSALVSTAAATTITLSANQFTLAGSGQVDRDYFAANDVVLFWSAEPADPTAPTTNRRTISSIDVPANQITINLALAGLNPATEVVYMTFSHHENDAVNPCVTAQTSRGTWIAGDDTVINNDDDFPAHPYTA